MSLARIESWLDAPQPIIRLELARILLPLTLLGFLSSRLVHADFWLTDLGFQVPYLGGHDWRQPLYLRALSPALAWMVAAMTVLAGLAVALGFRTRVSAAAFAGLLGYLALADRLESFTVSKLGPVLMMAVCLSPAGSRYSIDGWLRGRRGEQAGAGSCRGGAIRFFQLFLVVMYSGSGIAKARGDWLHADVLFSHVHDDYQTAVAYLLVRTLPAFGWRALQALTLVFEIGAPLWFGWRRTRTAALLAGLGMHAMIGLMFGPVIWFALLMSALLIVSYSPAGWLARLERCVSASHSNPVAASVRAHHN